MWAPPPTILHFSLAFTFFLPFIISNLRLFAPFATFPFYLQFFIFFNLKAVAMAAELSAQPDQLASSTPVHVLVVDDCLLDRKIVERLLKASSFKVTTVESGQKAIEVLGMKEEKLDKPSVNELDIDLILTDYCMPSMNGHDLLVAIKEDSCMKSIPVVIISSEFIPQRVSRCLADGAQEFLQKPLKVKDLEKLRSYVRPAMPAPKTGTKRKVLADMMPESNESERRPRLAGVAVS